MLQKSYLWDKTQKFGINVTYAGIKCMEIIWDNSGKCTFTNYVSFNAFFMFTAYWRET